MKMLLPTNKISITAVELLVPEIWLAFFNFQFLAAETLQVVFAETSFHRVSRKILLSRRLFHTHMNRIVERTEIYSFSFFLWLLLH